MIKEAIEKIIELNAKPETIEIVGRKYMLSNYDPVKEPTASALTINTLSGLVDFIKAKIDHDEKKERFLHVRNYKDVLLTSELFGDWRQRESLICAQTEPVNRMSNNWYNTEDFIIHLNSLFAHSKDYQYLAGIVSGLTESSTRELKDDGISQTTTVKQGISMLAEEKIKNPVTLQPYRTFPEIEQPEIEFTFRVRSGGQSPECALFEADGGKWKLDTVHKIRDYLKKELSDISINIIA